MPSQELYSWIHRWNQQVPERKSIEIKPPVPSETTTSPQNIQKQNLKDFTIIDRESNTLYHWAKEALHIHIKDPSLNRNIGKVRIPSAFNKLLKPPRQLELPQFYPPTQGGQLLHLVFQHKRQLTLHTFLASIYDRSIIPMFTPFKRKDNWTFRSPPSKKHIGKQFLHITKCHLLHKVFKLQVLWSSHQFIKQGWRSQLVSSENIS